MDNLFYSQGKLREYADAFRRLMNVYGGGGRTALSLQLKETAAMLERILGDSEEQADCIISEEQKGKLYDYLRSESINVSGILYLQPVKGRIEIVMRLSRKRGCITAGQLAQDIGEILGKRLRAAEGSRRVLGKDEGEFPHFIWTCRLQQGLRTDIGGQLFLHQLRGRQKHCKPCGRHGLWQHG